MLHIVPPSGADITDFFNYGFTEETWKLYSEKQRRTRSEVLQLNKIAVSSSRRPPDWYSRHPPDWSDRSDWYSRLYGYWSDTSSARELVLGLVSSELHCVHVLLSRILIILMINHITGWGDNMRN